MRPTVLAALMLGAAVNAAAQSHDAPKPEAKAAPVVSSITAAPRPTAPAEAGTAPAEGPAIAAKGKPKPLVSGAKAAGHEDAPAGPRVSGSPVTKPAAPTAHAGPAPAAPTAPANLSTVHGRITAALAELRAETAVAKGKGDGEGHGDAVGGAARGAATTASKPRFVVAWPGVRWHVVWRDARDRVTVSWPE